ncbi:glycoside hydrolase family 38 protein [Viridothelium virens]|uniref:Alpha-mannosidase n=1 Tax=Viridothelium virens TaxID=1048519 RepID=A0A6A6H8U2_VIRVR|nr:glycoside hydrolase family 38 protein [Viridothelium virens]
MGGETQMIPSPGSASYPKLARGPVGKQIHNIYRDRLRQFTDNGQYRQQSLRAKFYHARIHDSTHVKLSVYSPPHLERPTFEEATSHEFSPASLGDSFGPSWSTHWFRIHLTIPTSIKSDGHLEFHWDANNEGLIWLEDGTPVHGLTGGGERVEWILPEKWRDGKEHIFYVEMACNGMFGNAPGGDSIQPPKPDKYFTLHTADIVSVDLEARALYIDFWIIGDAAREFPEDSWEEHEALQVCNSIMDIFIEGNGSQESIREGRKLAQKYIGTKVDSSKVYDTDYEAIVSAIGHCHIDTCWLWPWAETKRKIARSWSNQCDLMDRYPEHRFCCSQAQQYKWLEQLYPSVYDRVKEKVKQGTFQPIGGSWVEHDTNMPSGESLTRQFLYGQRFFESRFGQRCKTFWLPDTFGYSTQLPQLCRLAGMSRFFTQKLSWNNINNFPHTTFNWVALDGSQVICHMAPDNTYTAEAHFGDVKRSVTQHKSMDQDATSLLVFGKGDGGGGPTWEHIEKLRRCRGISDQVGLLPRVKMGDSVDDFFARLEKKAENGTEFVTWYGELYFELHRGTYTTQANNKWNNRKAEILLHDIEYFATMATLKDTIKGEKSGYSYPKKDLDDMWEAVLLCQFHDCLPGSAIEMCYDDSDELYAKVFDTGKKLLKDALTALGFVDINSSEGRLTGLNTLPWSRKSIEEFTSPVEDSTHGLVVGSTGLAYVEPLESQLTGNSLACVKETKPGIFVLSNARFRLEVVAGAITSLYDLYERRQLVPPGSKANQLVLYDDKPLYWQAWDVEVYHLRSRTELQGGESKIVESGPNRVAVATTTKISEKSWIRTTISLDALEPSVRTRDSTTTSSTSTVDPCPLASASHTITVSAEAEWHETMKFLKVEFPTTIHNTDATYETQYGLVRRPTHYNTSWDMAKFEVCCHRFADLSDANYGLSILNDSKYGFATQGSTMRLSLLRAPKAPDAHADMGRHVMKWGLLPHQGPVGQESVRAGFEFNYPVRIRRFAGKDKELGEVGVLLRSLTVESRSGGLVLDWVKRGEDDEDVSRREGLPVREGRSVVVRVYDALGAWTRGSLSWGALPVRKVWRTNLLEDDEVEVPTKDKSIEVQVRAFEVVTWRLQL